MLSVFFPDLEEKFSSWSHSGERLRTQFPVPDGGRHVPLGSVAFGEGKQNNFLKAVPSQVSGWVDGLAIVITLRKRVAALIVLSGHQVK